MNRIVLLFLLFCAAIAYGQQERVVRGFLYDSKTKAPIEFANVGIVGKGIGTVSTESGFFGFSYLTKDASLYDVLQISTIGYKTVTIVLGTYHGKYPIKSEIYLEPIAYDLETVMLTNEERKYETIGSKSINDKTIGYWKEEKALGGEIATRMRIRKERTKLLNFGFYIKENLADSLLIRVNVYDYRNKYPRKNVLAKNIYHTVTKQRGAEQVDLSPYNIIVSEDIVISIELVEIYGKRIGFALAGSLDPGTSYVRYVSQDRWNKYDEIGLSFWLDISRPKRSRNSADIVRQDPDTMVIYWDASAAAGKRDIDLELDFLKAYFKTLKTVDVIAVKFGAGQFTQERFSVNSKTFKTLETYLKQTNYHGEVDYSVLEKPLDFKGDMAFLFSNGISSISTLSEDQPIPLFPVNSNPTAIDKQLQHIARRSGGYYINLNALDQRQALRFMKYDLQDNARYGDAFELTKEGNVYGIVSNEQGVLTNAFVTVKGSFNQVATNAYGEYIIAANPGDVLQIDYLGMLPKNVYVNQIGELDISLQTDGELLDEVVIQGRNQQEKMVYTAHGEKSFDEIGYAVTGITSEDISASHTTLDQLIVKLPGVVVKGIADEKRYMFARNMVASITLDANPIIVVDGIVYEQGPLLPPLDIQLPPIDLQTIVSIDALKSIVATNRYGALGAYGAIVIRTEATAYDFTPEAKAPQALISGNDFTEDLATVDQALVTPDYIVRYKSAASLDLAKQQYESFRTVKENQNVPFYAESALFFKEKDPNYSFQILSNIGVLAANNVKALRAYAFLLEAFKKPNAAQQVYQTVFDLEPQQAQSYLDLARIWMENDQIDKAYDYYKRILQNKTGGVNFRGVQKDAEFELRRLLNFYKAEVDYKDLPNTLLDPNFKKDVRIVLEWNDPFCEFEVQFVNPQKKYFSWSFDKFSNSALISKYIEHGVFNESFELDDSGDGQWEVAIKNLGPSQTVNPVYVKYTVYKDFGLPSETKTTRVINLSAIPDKSILDSFTN